MNKSLEKSNSIGTLPSKYKTIDVGGSTLNTLYHINQLPGEVQTPTKIRNSDLPKNRIL